MPEILVNLPGVQIREEQLGAPPIIGVGTSTAGFVGLAPKGGRFIGEPRLMTSPDQFIADYVLGTVAPPDPDATVSTPLSRAVLGFFANGGTACYVVNIGDAAAPPSVADRFRDGLRRLARIDEIAVLAAPGRTDQATRTEMISQAASLGDRFVILDPPARADITPAGSPFSDVSLIMTGGANRPPVSDDSIYAAFYYPRILVGPDLSGDPEVEAIAPSGHLAGVYARVDASRGVHKAPANEIIRRALGVEDLMTDAQQNLLNPDGVNIIRLFAGSPVPVVWGARTLQQQSAPQDALFLYVNVRRLVNFIEESLQDGLRFAVFEPNTLALRQQITRSIRGFLDGVWRDGALFGATPDEAYYVRFPPLFNRDEDRAAGRLTVEIGLRATMPAEFIVIRIGVILQPANAA